jgi:hypothetical protein
MRKLLFWGIPVMLITAGCGQTPPSKKNTSESKPEYSKTVVADTKKQPVVPVAKTPSESKPGAVDSVINYATGKTHVDIKKKKARQLQEIQDRHNQQIKDALGN